MSETRDTRRTDGLDVAMVLAAGLGTRMRPLTETTPKPLLRAGGTPLIDHALDRAVEIGVTRAVVNVHHLADQVRRHLSDRAAPRIDISDETAALLETGGGVKRALPLISRDAFLVVNSDNLWAAPRAFAPLPAAWDPARMDALLLLVRREETISHRGPGDFSLTPLEGSAAGLLVRRGDAPSAPFVYTGAQILTARAFADAPDGAFSLNLVWDRLIATGRAFGVLCDGPWYDVGAPDGLAAADAAFASNNGGAP